MWSSSILNFFFNSQICVVYAIVVLFHYNLFIPGKNSVLASSLSLSELLLRIDSMVLSGLLSKGEASELRKKWMESKVTIHDALGDIHHKTDEQLLSDLRTISEKITRCVHNQYCLLLEASVFCDFCQYVLWIVIM